MTGAWGGRGGGEGAEKREIVSLKKANIKEF